MGLRRAGAFVVSFAVTLAAVGSLAVAGVFSTPAHSAVAGGSIAAATTGPRAWTTKSLTGSVQIRGEVPLSVAAGKALYVRPLPANWKVTLNFGFPITATASLNKLIVQEARTHDYITRAELYTRYSPPRQQVSALARWLQQHGLRVTHVGADRLSVGISATAGQVERALHVKLDEYIRPAYTFDGIKVQPYAFYANTSDPTVPARFGLQTVSGLSSVDRFYTDAQIAQAHTAHAGSLQPVSGDGAAQVRSGGYYPSDLRSMYDVPAAWNGAGQTIGFTLWGAGETQGAMTSFASTTGDQPITVLPPCTATGNSPTQPSSCTTVQVGADDLLTILENGNTNNNFAGNDETALDIEQAHGIATHVGMKYYDGDCEALPPPGSGLSNGSGCNGSDVGLEDAIEDAANDPTLHSVSNSWIYGGDPEWGLSDPFVLATQNSLMIAVAAGTTFWWGSGDTGTYEAGYPSDSPYVVAVGGTSLFSTSNPAQLSTEDTWAAGGSWCSNIFPRPAWQTGPSVAAHASCPGRAIPDVSAIADTNTSVREVYSTGATNFRSGSVGGTSVAGPEWNGLEAVVESYVAAQTYPAGKAPAVGFFAPVIYQLGDSNQNDYYRDVLCGNVADPTGSPDGEAALPGWDEATGWGAPDFLHFATGYAVALGATGLTTPSSLSPNYSWTCAKTPTNASLRSVSFPSTAVGYSVGASSSSTPWYATYLPSGSWGADNTVYSSGDGGQTWTPTNSDMLSISCTGVSACVEVGDGGVIRTTSNGGTSWTTVASPVDKALTQVTCPSTSVCYAAGDRGYVIKSTNGGQTWSYLSSTDGNPIYGLDCTSTTTCYATDIYAHIVKTTNGGSSWTWQSTPVTTPGVDVPGSGGPNPFAGLFGVSCVDAAGQDCVAVGGFPPSGTTAPIVATTNGGMTWTSDNVTAPASDWLAAVTCLPGTTTCYAVGRGGDIEATTDMVNWTQMTSNTTNMLNDVTCSSTTSCVAVGQNGTVDVLTGSTWAPTTGVENNTFFASVTCPQANYFCYATGKQGMTIAFIIISPTSIGWEQLAGGGLAAQMNSISCPSTSTCFAVGNAVSGLGSIETTTDGGQIWSSQQATGTGQNLNGVSCSSPTNCVAVGNIGITENTSNGVNWNGVNTGPNNLEAVSCAGSSCTAVGVNGTIMKTTNGGQSWTPQTSGTTATLNAVTCPTASTCLATGAIPAGASSAVMLATTNGGASWTAQTSNSPQALSSITCLDAFNCFAGGAGGTVVTTNNGGSTWTQQGNPLSGPTTALNASVSSLDAINAVSCSSTECAMGTGSSGDIMISPLLTVTVNATQTAPQSVNLTNLPANSPAISYSPASQAPNVTGTLTCTSTATPQSSIGTYPVSNCSGLSDNGYSIVYNYAASSYAVTFPFANTNPTGQVPSTLSVSIANVAPSFGAFTAGVAQTYTTTTSATITSSAASATFQAADPSSTFPGHLVNTAASGGPYELTQGLQVAANDPSNTTGSGVFSNLANTNPATLLTYSAPIASDPVTITFQQPIAATDPLRTGTYTKTITFTLSTSTP